MAQEKVTLETTIIKIDKETGIATVETIARDPKSGKILTSFPKLFIEAGGSLVFNNVLVEVE